MTSRGPTRVRPPRWDLGHDGQVTIELSVLAHPSDLAFLEVTLRHQLRHFAASTTISRRVVVADYSGAEAEDARRLRDMIEGLVEEGALDETIDVDWDPVTVGESMQRWFGRADTPPRAGRTRPRYQYAHSLDVAERNLVLHLDSDVLFWGSLDWVDQSPNRFGESEQLLAIVPMAGPPQARTARDWMLGPRAGRSPWPLGPNRSDSLTTRHVVFHRNRLETLCPLDAVGEEHFEAIVTLAMRGAGMHRLTTIGAETLAWHPHDHNDNHCRGIEHLIRVVEAGGYPYRRWGAPWDIATSGRGYLPWRFARARQQHQSWTSRSERTPE